MIDDVAVGLAMPPGTTVDDVVRALSPLRGHIASRSGDRLTLTVGNQGMYRMFGAFTKIGRRHLPLEITVDASGPVPTVRVGLRHILSVTPRLDAERRALHQRAATVDDLLRAL